MALAQTKMTLFTIGYGGKALAQFVGALVANHIDVIVDVRRWPSTRNVPYAQKQVLKNLLVRQKINYIHMLEFAPSESLLARYKNGLSASNEEAKWRDYVAQYTREIDNDKSKIVFQHIIDSFRSPCFLCAEKGPIHCHRRILVEQMKTRLNLDGWAIKHL